MKIAVLNEPLVCDLSVIAPDKSLSHRAAIFSLFSDKTSAISNFLISNDTLMSLEIVRNLGAKVEIKGDCVKITPFDKISQPNSVLECGNSGTTMRIFLGFLASCEGFFVLNGDKYLNSRPMKRLSAPLNGIGAKIYGRDDANLAPLCICGTKLKYFKFSSQIASAQVKTALLLAGLNSNGCKISEPELSRNHSEKMLKAMGAEISTNGLEISIQPLKKALNPLDIQIANDPSSAFYFAVAAAIIPHSSVILRNVILNETRIFAYEILKQMGADINFTNIKQDYEIMGDIEIKFAPLNAICVSEKISWLIDEAPALAIAFACAKGTSVLKNAKELRVKESDRIKLVVSGLKACGISANELEDGFEITGGDANAAIITPNGDHRIAMSFAILGLKCGMIIENSQCISTSFPNFAQILRQIGASVEN